MTKSDYEKIREWVEKNHVFLRYEVLGIDKIALGYGEEEFVSLCDLFDYIESLVGVCEWTWDSDGFYNTKCGQGFFFDTGNVKENSFCYCPYCGKEIEVKDDKERI